MALGLEPVVVMKAKGFGFMLPLSTETAAPAFCGVPPLICEGSGSVCFVLSHRDEDSSLFVVPLLFKVSRRTFFKVSLSLQAAFELGKVSACDDVDDKSSFLVALRGAGSVPPSRTGCV